MIGLKIFCIHLENEEINGLHFLQLPFEKKKIIQIIARKEKDSEVNHKTKREIKQQKS